MGESLVTYQTFGDKKKDKSHARIIHEHKIGREEALRELIPLNENGAGVFWMVNEGDGKGRSNENVVKVRFLIMDLDEDGKERLKKIRAHLPPHAIIESSPGKYQVYVKVRDLPIDQFTPIQEALNKKFGGDEKIKDIARVMRLPGFFHQKGKPFVVRIVNLKTDLAPYSIDDIKKLISFDESKSSEDKSKSHKKDWESIFKKGVEQGDRDNVMASLAGHFLQKGLSRDQVLSLLTDFNSRCRPPLGTSKGDKTVEQVLESVLKTVERKHPTDWLQEMNAKYFVTQIGGKTVVCWEEYSPELGRYILQTSSFGDFRNFHSNRIVPVGKKSIGIGSAWLDNEERRQYEKIVLHPEGETPPGCFNLWKGFSVKPNPGDWSFYEKHLREVVCQSNEEYYQYLIKWMANAVQHPGKQGWAAVVLRGDRGAGKGITAQNFGVLFGQHFLHITSSHHLTGHFNSHLRDCIFLFVDEAFWAGDKKGEGVLKGLITERMITIEGKGKDAEFAPNRLHILMATNSAWAVPAGPKERRFFVLDVGDNRIGDKAYFRNLMTQMEAGGRGALLHDLQKIDISDFDVSVVPDTAALNEQKLHSMDLIQQYWFELLLIGGMPVYDWGERTYSYNWTHVTAADLYGDYVNKAGLAGMSYKGMQTMLMMGLRKLLPRPYPKAHRHTDNSGKRVTTWEFPPLEECRKHFERFMKMKINWEKESEKKKIK